MSSSTDEEIIDLLEQILKVLALQVGQDKSLMERAWLLQLAGIDNKTIAEVLNTNAATVRALTSTYRRRQKSSRAKPITGAGGG